MTLPGWIDPDEQDERATGPQGAGPVPQRAEAEPEPVAEPPAAAEADVTELQDKPVLEWTNDDWARWIDNAEGASLARTKAAVSEAEGQDELEAVEAEAVEAEAVGVRVDRMEEAPADDEWAAVSDHAWWDSAPVLDAEPVVFDEDPPTPVEVPVATPPPPIERPTVTATTTRPAQAIPTSFSSAGAAVRRQPEAPEVSHRVRSAFGLLGVAMSVGVVVAGLITVAVFAISVALRHAVG